MRELRDLSRRIAERIGGVDPAAVPPIADWVPSTNIHETAEAYEIEAELPEVRREDAHVGVENGVLTLSGERRRQCEIAHETAISIESDYGSFVRAFRLPDDADVTHIDAQLDSGMLRVRIARVPRQASAPRAIPVL
jgi:HSP20 family protein